MHLATEKAYGDFEFRVDWLLTQAGGDSGIYLRDYPQVRLWDPANTRELKKWRGLRDPAACGTTILTTRANGRWSGGQSHRRMNSLAIKMVGTRVWVTLNENPSSSVRVLDNFFDRAQPFSQTGINQLQTHGSVRFRNVYVRDIPKRKARRDGKRRQ